VEVFEALLDVARVAAHAVDVIVGHDFAILLNLARARVSIGRLQKILVG
jgi:hypothetical protein